MYEIEFLVFIVSGIFSFFFFMNWYGAIFRAWPPERSRPARYLLGSLPAVSFAVILYTLKVLASFDVVGDGVYIFFYIALGYAWIYLGVLSMSLFFDLSWIDDGMNLNNKAALSPLTGGFLAVTAIYAGANIGDGPGWWCVVFAGGLGLLSWIALGIAINLLTGVFERVTVGRDIGCGIRLGFYLLASGILFGRASAGDWTSFYMTVVEFMAGWPVLPLAALFVLVERYYLYKSKMESDMGETGGTHLPGSLFWGTVYVIIAVVGVLSLPLSGGVL